MAETVSLFGIEIDRLDMQGAVDQILGWCRSGDISACHYVVTPNVDHTVMYQHNASLRAAYAKASLVLADGFPLVVAARLFRRALPERVAGSDLVPALFDAVGVRTSSAPFRVFLLGAGPGVADRAAENIHRRWQNVEVVGTLSPPLGFEHDVCENEKIFTAIAHSRADLLLVGLGAPKQELWVSRHREQISAKAVLCVGATIDFLAGEKSRSPRWMQNFGLEWLHRACSEPRRLIKRYARDAWIFPQLVWREWRRSVRVNP